MDRHQEVELDGGPLDGQQESVNVEFYCSRRGLVFNSGGLVYERTEEWCDGRVVYREREYAARLRRWRKKRERTDK